MLDRRLPAGWPDGLLQGAHPNAACAASQRAGWSFRLTPAGAGAVRTSNRQRIQALSQIGVQLAVHTDVCVSVGSGSGKTFQPSLRMATGSPDLAYGVASGELDVAFVNPSAMLTQAYRGTGLFSEALPVRAIACFPSWDRFVVAVHPRTGLRSFLDIPRQRCPLRLSIREDPTHSTRTLIDQLFRLAGFTLDDVVSWGGSLQLNQPPHDPARLAELSAGSIDVVLDEGIRNWLPHALANGMQLLPLDESLLVGLEQIGWRRAILQAYTFPNLAADHICLDYSGWPLYTRASLPEDDAYSICAALFASEASIPWEDSYVGFAQLPGGDAAPLEVPLHPGAERWYREHGFMAPA